MEAFPYLQAPILRFLVGSVYGVPAIRSQDVIGCGYNLNGIQRIKVGGALWIPITQPDENAHYGGRFQQCDRRIKGRSHFCCINCRLMQVHIGIGMAMAQRLVECAATFGQPIHVLDRLCRQCLRVFCSESCPDHLSHQHPDGNAAAALVEPIIIEQTNGWAAIELGQLPAGLAQNIQMVLSEDGRDMCPIQRLRPGCLFVIFS
uniref:Uncharacterized protein n=1 Tax=Oryza punctata TaxID=4537 RepID=A0A0E0JNR4_ORYPU